jgi:hypothetical protein
MKNIISFEVIFSQWKLINNTKQVHFATKNCNYLLLISIMLHYIEGTILIKVIKTIHSMTNGVKAKNIYIYWVGRSIMDFFCGSAAAVAIGGFEQKD